MKKFLTSILAMLYLSTSMGMTVHMHYCMDKLVAVNLWHDDEKDACSNCGMQKGKAENNGCCKDEHKEIKTDKAQKSASLFIAKMVAGTAELPQVPVYTLAMPVAINSNATPLIHGPPGTYSIPLFIRNCVFRI